MKIKEENPKGPKQSGNHPMAQSRHPLNYSTLNICHSKILFLHFKYRPLETQPQSHPTGSTTPPGKWVPGPGPQWPRAGLQAGTLGSRAPHRANLRNLVQSSACQWVRKKIWGQQTAAQSLSQTWWRWTSDWTSVFFISKQGQWQPIHTSWEIKPQICLVNVSLFLQSSLTVSGDVLWTQEEKS